MNGSQPVIMVGAGTCGRAAGAEAVIEAIDRALVKHGIEAVVMTVGCIGLCYAEVLVDIAKPGRPRISYGRVTPKLAEEIVRDYLLGDDPRPDLALGSLGEGAVAGIGSLFELPMLRSQVRIVMRNCGFIDPKNIDHYIARRGYQALSRALAMSPEAIIAEVKRSGLRGRGGAGFPTGLKWELCRDAPGEVKYLICNGDEGDPGAFMDRSVLEGDPHSVLEGMLIAAYAVGATKGYLYVRAEYPLAVENLTIALRQAEEYGLVGHSVLGSGFSFPIEIKEGAGAFVCGEETALIASIEGRRGLPRARPPYPTQAGLWGQPTVINNVETFANVPPILDRGAEWYASYGTATSPGTKTFALAGKIERSGLIEVPMGISLQELVFGIGGGIDKGKAFKAVQTGGPIGGCIPSAALDLPVDFDSLTRAGAIMGSGGMVVMDEDTCMVDVARFFLAFAADESCGKCLPCRLGTKQMLTVLERITQGQGRQEDIDLLLDLADTVGVASLCGLGVGAPNPVISTIRYFRDEYEAHIKHKRCPAAVCRGLVKAPCSHTCPASIDVPRYVRAIAEGKFGEALAVIREQLPFAAICGLVCFHPCEAKCRRGQVDDPIAIRALKRIAYEQGQNGAVWGTIAPPSGKRVAIVGSGPAGLTAAYYLRKLGGHAVTIFEALPEPGGMMRVGIPRYRLPADVLDAETDIVRRLGVEIRTNTRVNSIDELFADGYDAIFLALGAHRGQKMGIGGEDGPGVIDCVTLLRNVSLGQPVSLGERVVVVGGGNAAIDAARTALRLGSKEVTIVYRRTRAEMPASAEEVEEALHEGVNMVFLAAPSRITRDNGRVRLECLRMQLGRVDASGRRRPEPIPGSEFVIEANTVVAAIGQSPEVPPSMGLATGPGGIIRVDPDTLATEHSGVFAGGDVVSGPASVIEAVAAGRQAAISIDRYLGGSGVIEEKLAPPEEAAPETGIEEGEKRRVPIPSLPLHERLPGLAQVEMGYTKARAIEEARRCLRCDLEE